MLNSRNEGGIVFNLTPTKEFSFASIDETLAFVAEEKRRIQRVSLKDCWSSYQRFFEDTFFGDSRVQLTFNEHGFRDLLNLIGIPEQVIFGIKKECLTTEIINDFIERLLEEKEKLEAARFIYDSSDMTVIGVTSKRSSGSNNEEFLRTILSALDKRNINAIFPHLENFKFIGGSSNNTKFRLSLVSKEIKSELYSNRARSIEYNELGLDLTNDIIIGNTTLISTFVHNAVKGTKLLIPMLEPDGQLLHHGNAKKYEKQLHNSTIKALKQLNKTATTLEKLAVIPFSAETIAAHTDFKNLLSILPNRDLNDAINKRLRTRDYSIFVKKFSIMAKNADKITLLAELLEKNDAERLFQLDKITKATMYDFISLFSNYSILLPNKQRLEMERRVGGFFNWLDQNRRKFI